MKIYKEERMKGKLFQCYLENLLLEDNQNIPVQRINYYIDEIMKELKFCKITQKSIGEINLHEFGKCDKNYKGIYRKYFVLLVTIIYNGDFEHTFEVYYLQIN